jgi:hypothetical protein
MGWPLRITQVRGLFADAWRLRANVTFADAVYVALAGHLGADLLSDDCRPARQPARDLTRPPHSSGSAFSRFGTGDRPRCGDA